MRDGVAAHRPIGVLMLDTRFPRVLGDIGNPSTFPFPVQYLRIPGAYAEDVVRRKPTDLLRDFVHGAQELERRGVAAITTTCGFLARFQREVAEAVCVPVCTSGLMLVPLVHRMLSAQAAVGILTIDGSALGEAELRGAGITPDTPVVIAGLEGEPEFARAILQDRPTLNADVAREEHVRVARRLMAAHPNVRAIVLECTNMPPYRDAIRSATGLPVFDILHLVTLLRHACLPAVS